MKVVRVNRKKQDTTQTLGFVSITGDNGEPLYADISLERGWRDNKQNVSCIPEGAYPLKKEYSPRFKMDLWEIKEVKGRSECKFHAANYWHDLNGCIAPGVAVKDIDGDGRLDITSSRASLKRFHKAMGDDTEALLIVKNDFPEEVEDLLC